MACEPAIKFPDGYENDNNDLRVGLFDTFNHNRIFDYTITEPLTTLISRYKSDEIQKKIKNKSEIPDSRSNASIKQDWDPLSFY